MDMYGDQCREYWLERQQRVELHLAAVQEQQVKAWNADRFEKNRFVQLDLLETEPTVRV